MSRISTILRATSYIVNVIVIILVATIIYSALSIRFTVGDTSWDFKNNTLYVQIPVHIRNPGFYPITDLSAEYYILDDTNNTIYHGFSLLGDIPASRAEQVKVFNFSGEVSDELIEAFFRSFNATLIARLSLTYAYWVDVELYWRKIVPWTTPIYAMDFSPLLEKLALYASGDEVYAEIPVSIRHIGVVPIKEIPVRIVMQGPDINASLNVRSSSTGSPTKLTIRASKTSIGKLLFEGGDVKVEIYVGDRKVYETNIHLSPLISVRVNVVNTVDVNSTHFKVTLHYVVNCSFRFNQTIKACIKASHSDFSIAKNVTINFVNSFAEGDITVVALKIERLDKVDLLITVYEPFHAQKHMEVLISDVQG